jgi:hypothetical protein
VGLAPVGVVPVEVDSSAQLCPCPDRPVAGHAAWCLAARLVSMAFLEAAAAALAAVMLCQVEAAGSHTPGSSEPLPHSAHFVLAGL